MIVSEKSNDGSISEAKGKSIADGYASILRMPKASSVLDYLKRELLKKLPLNYEELVDALLEMHRTSTGFNPAVLSKARFKRMKVSECKVALSEINDLLGQLLESEEYNLLFGNSYNYSQILTLQQELNMAKESRDVYRFSMVKLQLKNLLLERNEFELLLWVFKVSIDYYSKHKQNDLASASLEEYIKCYNDLRDKINLKIMVDRNRY